MTRGVSFTPTTDRATILADRVDQVRMLGDRILLKPLEWQPSKILEVVRYGRTLRGIVMAIGPGHNPIKYRNGRAKMDYSRRFRATEVRVGDVVELGGLNIYDGQGYQFPEVLVGNERMLIVTERDVALIDEQATRDYANRGKTFVTGAPHDPQTTYSEFT